MKNKQRTIIFILLDYSICLLSWYLFYFSRKKYIENSNFSFDLQFYKGMILVPLFWILIYLLQGTYNEIKRLYRSRIFNLTFIGNLLGSSLLFFLILVDDKINSYQNYYHLFLILFLLQLTLTLTIRLIFVSIQVYRIQNGYDFFNTLLIGNPDSIIEFEKELNSLPKKIGNKIVAIILNQSDLIVNKHLLEKKLISSHEEVDLIIKNKQIEETILLDNNLKNNNIQYLIAKCSGLGVNVKIKASDQDIALGSIKQNNLFGLLIKEIQFDPLPFWQKSIKRILDIVISVISLLVLTPFFILIAVIINRTSKGPVFFTQERIGKHGQPFNIIKFRTMYLNSEKNGPQLSSANDSRITRFGKFLRKTRIDEFPQFINVIKGEMSLVGPRPERQFYIDKIAEKEPSFLQLTLIKPGITSWGQVKYGYAENVEEMIQRMRFDLLYLKNRTLALDFKIMFYTLITILKAKGK